MNADDLSDLHEPPLDVVLPVDEEAELCEHFKIYRASNEA